MFEVEKELAGLNRGPVSILDDEIPTTAYTQIDLSTTNEALKALNIGDPVVCQGYIDRVLEKNSAAVAYGGYLEKRKLYTQYGNFQNQEKDPRNIHLGMDFWASAGTKVHTPLPGVVHSFRNNNTKGDYGPTIILKHNSFNRIFYTLYGHLSLDSLDDLSPGKVFERGAILARLGTSDVNVNYAPHLHFQLIVDLEGYYGDYPGVCRISDLDFYTKNCPDPNLLLRL